MIDNLSRSGYSVTRLSASLSGSAKWPLLKSWHSLHLGIFSRGGATAAKIYTIRANLSQELGSLLPYSPVSTSGEQLKNGQVSGSLSLYPDMAERERVMEGHRQRAIRSKRWWTGRSYLAKSSFSPPVYVWQCPWDTNMVRVWARYS